MPILDEDVLSLAEARNHLPLVNGRRPHYTTLWRWCREGVGPRKVRLEHVRLGGTILTSRQALSRFTEALAAADEAPVIGNGR